MRTLNLILLLIAAACFLLAAAGANVRRGNLLAAGLLAWVLVPLIAEIRAS